MTEEGGDEEEPGTGAGGGPASPGAGAPTAA